MALLALSPEMVMPGPTITVWMPVLLMLAPAPLR